jgi:UDP-glucose 4-epimerase
MWWNHTDRRDVGLAFANAVRSREVWGTVLLIGGGPRCQYLYGEIAEAVLSGLGVGMLPQNAFASVPFPTDWLDTSESQRLLRYQRHTLDAYVQNMVSLMGYKRHLVRAFRPLIRTVLLRQSAHFHAGQPMRLSVVLQGLKALKRQPTRAKVG